MADWENAPAVEDRPAWESAPPVEAEKAPKQESTLHKLLFGREAAEGLRAGIQSLVPQSIGGAAKMAFYTPVEEAPHAIKEAVDVLRGVPTAQAVPESQTLVGFTEKPLREQVKIGTQLAGQVGTGVFALSQILHPVLGRGEISPVAATEGEVIKSATQERQIQKGIQPERAGTPPRQDVPAYAPQVREVGGEQAGRGDSLRAATEVPQEVETATEVTDHPTVEFPLSKITLSKDVPQFKAGANEKGIVEPLAGKYERIGTAPVQLWERLNGDTELISGRHRLDLAQRTGEQTIPSQIHREAEGFGPAAAARLDAELNIRDNQGSTGDYANYFKNSGLSEEDANARGLLARAKGKAGFAIARDGSEDVFALHQSGRLTDSQAQAIATAAPGNAGAQQVGIRAALQGKSAEFAGNLIKAATVRTRGAAQTGDLFAFDDTAMRQMENQARVAGEEQRKIREQISAVSGASKKPEVAASLGVDVKDPAAVQAKVAELRAELARWENWPLEADLLARTRGETVQPVKGGVSEEVQKGQEGQQGRILESQPSTREAAAVSESVSSPAAAPQIAAQIRKAVDRYDFEEQHSGAPELADDLEQIDNLPKPLSDALTAYRDAVEEDRTEWGMRSDIEDSEGAALYKEAQKWAAPETQTPPKLLPGEMQGDLISSTQQEPFALTGEKITPTEEPKAITPPDTGTQDLFSPQPSTVDHPAVTDFKEHTTSSPQSLGLLPRPSEFVRQDVAKVVTGISKGIRQIKAALTPANVSPIAGQTARIVREHAGQLARDREIASVALQDAAQILRRNSKAQNLAIIDRLEKGQPLGNKGLDDYRSVRQTAYDQRIKQVQEVNPKAMQDLIENYFPHIWTRESIERLAGNLDKVPADNPWARVFGKRPLTGPATFLKQRTIPTTADGIAIGLEPVTTNPVALDLLKMHEMDRYVMGHKIMQEMKDNGLAKFVPAGERPDFGHVKINDRIARVYGPRGWKIVDEQGRQMPGQKVLGDYYAPEDAARIINNYLSPGLRGNAVYDSFRLLGNTMNQVQLGISAYHAFFTAIDSATSTIALGLEQIARSGGSLSEIAKGTGQIAKGFVETPVGSMIENLWRGNKFLREYSKPGTTNAELAKIVDTATAGGSRVRMDTFYNTGAVEKFFDALKSGNYTGALLRAPLALVQTVAKPLMEYTVPRLKLGIISQQLEYELSKLPKNATQDQMRIVAGRVVDSVDNRMGQLIYDNLFWNKALKDGLMASVRSVGWNLGDIRELGGGALDSITAPKRAYTALTKGTEIADNPVFTKRMAYTFALPLYVGVLGSIYQYLMTGKGPQSIQDAFMPRTGRLKADGTEERVMLPTYMKDVYPLALAAGREGVTGLVSRSYRMAVNKLHPALSSIGQMIHNQDYYGNQILSPDDPLIQQHPTMGKIYREAEFIAKQFQPFSFRGVAQREGGVKEKLQAVAGIMPATRELTDTPAMRMIHDINLTKRPAGGYTKVQQQKRADRRAAQTGQDLRPELFKRLSNEEKARVLEVATPEERAVFQSGSSGRSRIRRTR